MKFMILIYILFVESAFISSANALKPADFCKLPKKRCTGYLDKYLHYTQSCEEFICQGIYSYPCTDRMCTLDKRYCDVFLNLKLLAPIYTRLNAKYVSLNKNLKECPFATYTFHVSDACLNGRNCYARDGVSNSGGGRRSLKNVICPCSGKLGYKCGSNYCTLHNQACHALNLLNNTVHLKDCGNDEQIIQHRNFIYF